MHGENCQVRIAISKRESEVAQGRPQDLPLPVQCSNLLETEKERARWKEPDPNGSCLASAKGFRPCRFQEPFDEYNTLASDRSDYTFPSCRLP